MIGPDSTLREIAAAAFDVGLRVTFEAMPQPSRADYLTAQYGPQGTHWRWKGPWRWQVFYSPVTGNEKHGWERSFVTPETYLDTGESVWDNRTCHHFFFLPVDKNWDPYDY